MRERRRRRRGRASGGGSRRRGARRRVAVQARWRMWIRAMARRSVWARAVQAAGIAGAECWSVRASGASSLGGRRRPGPPFPRASDGSAQGLLPPGQAAWLGGAETCRRGDASLWCTAAVVLRSRRTGDREKLMAAEMLFWCPSRSTSAGDRGGRGPGAGRPRSSRRRRSDYGVASLEGEAAQWHKAVGCAEPGVGGG
jgi:hypothetical protein